jgi:muramoyltetrapeptide carboxypeptidase LdcA involved in peptidoglycan recycling
LMQTALGLLRAGLKVWVVAPACGSRSAQNHELAMQRLRQAGAGIVSLEMVAFEWLQTCGHERFKVVLKLLKEQPVARTGAASENP